MKPGAESALGLLPLMRVWTGRRATVDLRGNTPRPALMKRRASLYMGGTLGVFLLSLSGCHLDPMPQPTTDQAIPHSGSFRSGFFLVKNWGNLRP